jgi:hypothetical protein
MDAFESSWQRYFSLYPLCADQRCIQAFCASQLRKPSKFSTQAIGA